MTIQILPARLANQIAAGEVVERPASVVKELVENSLDAGSTRIDIDIEKGGSKLIRIRDNGKGIDQAQLSLALSRHATSKIHTLDDLEAITSLGFRGEALASISSVSRLTLTSRTATQDQACSAYSEGRDMKVKITPSAHPIGTSVEVLDLFFNTPARRKFLRTEKTEFSHIDELLKRIALSRFDVTFNLKHNGKMVRQYRAAKLEGQIEKRLAAICGANFVRHRLQVELEHQDFKLHGWITEPDGARAQGDIQYCYVNGRMMKDKLINHAIRQSYENALNHDQFAAYVLFIEIDPHQVDVNVHPAKHEVRFHQARLVHDFIYQALTGAIHESLNIESANSERGQAVHTEHIDYSQPAHESIQYPNQAPIERFDDRKAKSESIAPNINERQPDSQWKPGPQRNNPRDNPQKPVSQRERQIYGELLKVDESAVESSIERKPEPTQKNNKAAVEITSIGKVLAVVEDTYVLVDTNAGCQLMSTERLEWLRLFGQLNPMTSNSRNMSPLKGQPLLIPLALPVEQASCEVIENYQELLIAKGIHIQVKGNSKVLVMAMPQPLREKNLQQLMAKTIQFLIKQPYVDSQTLTHFLVNHAFESKSRYTLSEAIQLIADAEQLWLGKLPLNDSKLLQPLQLQATISAFDHD